MMSPARPRVYVETSIVSYLTARPARDIVIAGRQQATCDWWDTAATRFDLVVSQLVREEAAGGDPEAAAQARLAALSALAALAVPAAARWLSRRLVDSAALPKRAARDATHVAIAAVHGVEFVVTWNFRHIANAVSRQRIESVCRRAGVEPPVLCTPQELVDVEVEDDER